MKEKKENRSMDNFLTLDDPCLDTKYRAWYRCSNCGAVFEYDLQKGSAASSMSGICPYCGIKSKTANVGVFPIVKFNPELDGQSNIYFK